MRINRLTGMAFYINGAIDRDKHRDITIETVKERCERGAIFDFLKERCGLDFDMCALSSEDRQEIAEEWRDMALAIDESRKLDVKNNGLCLLLAYLFEGIQRRASELTRSKSS